MILKASQRANSRELAVHLLKGHENEHVEVHEISGFVANTLHDALQEAHALSRGTKCQQFLFSVSLNPPPNENVPTSAFEDALERIEEKMGLEGQPRAVVFHEKHGRRHAHCVWSRINTAENTAINLPFFKNKMMEISKELYLEHGWKLPQGFIDRKMRNPLNFTLAQWQQAKRLGDSPQSIKLTLKECWVISDSKAAFSQALEQKGFYLAKGDRRGFVAVDWRGEVYSLSRWLDVKTKVLKSRLGDREDLPSVDETKAKLDKEMAQRIQIFIGEIKQRYDRRISPILVQKKRLTERQIEERKALADKQEKCRQQELRERQARFKTGLSGLWDRLTGAYAQIKKKNEFETYQSYLRDRAERDIIIHHQIENRRVLQQSLNSLHSEQQETIAKLKESLFSKLPNEKTVYLEKEFDQPLPEQNHGLEM